VSWNGSCRWIPRSLALTSTLRARPATFGGAPANYTVPWPEPADHALGHSRGGWTTKAHAAVDAIGRPLAIRLTAGQAGDNPELMPVLADIAVPTAGRPRSRPLAVIADKAYSHPSTRQALRRRRIRAVIPQRSDQIALRQSRGSRGGRPPRFDRVTYRGRNVVERAFGRLKQWRGIATRYDKHARNYRAGIVLAAIVMFWLR
jgi:transposase